MPAADPSRLADGRLAQAVRQLERIVAAHPKDTRARHNLALLLLESGNRDAARRQLRELLRLSPDFAPASFALGRIAFEDGNLAAAEGLLRTAATATAFAIHATYMLAEVLKRLERPNEAIPVLSWLIEQQPPSPLPYIDLIYLLLAERPADALPIADIALGRFPDHAELCMLRGYVQLRLKAFDDAIACLKRANASDPGLHAAFHLLHALRESVRWDEEAEVFAQCRELLRHPAPDKGTTFPMHSALNFPFDEAELKTVARNRAVQLSRITPLPPADPPPPAPLVVGYLSPDYRDHAIAHLVADLFAAHDPSRVRAVAFSVGPQDASTVRATIVATAHPFVDLRGLSDRNAAERIRAEGTHVLVDLSLYTEYHHPGIAAYRPAPIQVAWLGLPCTTGAPWFDYLFVDDVVAPPEHADRFTETLIHLPCGYQPNRRLTPLPPPPGRAAEGLPNDAVVFGCFNAHLKIDEPSFSAWIEVLAAVPNAVLWLLTPPDAVAARYRAFAAARGVDPARLIFAAKRPREAHLARLAHADLMLDCLIYGAHTTCSDALRAGVPMLTVLGENFAARVGASLLIRSGMPDLVLPDRDAFVAEAIRLGRDAAARDALRSRLAARVPTSPVFDTDAQARALEDAFEAIWVHRKQTRP